MPKEVNWKYSEKCFNFYDSAGKFEGGEAMFAIIDSSKKDELQEIFTTGINIKYNLYKKYLFQNNLFLFDSLEHNIKESVYCLIIGAYTASITNTNLILEKAVKLALIQYHSEDLLNYSDDELIKKYIDSDKKFSGRNLDQNIQTCKSLKIFNDFEANELKEYKVKYRDGFSHFTPKNILRGDKSLFHTEGELIDQKMETIFKLPTYQAIEVMQFAINKAEDHLQYVMKIINHLQYKVLEKFAKKGKCS